MANSSPALAAQNKAALDHFIHTPVTTSMVSYLARKATSVIRCEQPPQSNNGDLPTPPSTPPAYSTTTSAEPGLPSLEEFITSIVQQSHVQVPTLMPALIYLDRLREKLPPVAQGIPSTVHRIFLAALILAAKNLNDSSPKNKHWARYTSVPGYPDFEFTNSEVNLMEKQLLFLLDWDLRVTNEDLYFHLEPFLAPIRVKQQQQADRKLQAMLRERERTAQLQQAQAQYEYRQQQRKHAQSISILATAQAQVALPQIVSEARRTRSRELYDSPRSTLYADSPTASTLYHAYPRANALHPYSQSSTRAPPTRTPSLSPPTRCPSSNSYNSSASASPASFMSQAPSQVGRDYQLQLPAKPQEAKIQVGNLCEMDDHQYAYQYGYEVPQIIHIPAQAHAVEKTLSTRPREEESAMKPAKKLKTSAGNLFSRLLNGGISHAIAPTQAPVGTAC